MKKRLLFYTLQKYIDHKNALVITGMRQVGKTTLIRQVFEEIKKPKVFLDFTNPLEQKIFEEVEYRNIYERLTEMAGAGKEELVVFIDEIQYFPDVTRVMKFLIDNYKVKFVVTGSSSFYLKNLFPESLSGRRFLFELSPMGFRECLYFRDKIDLEMAKRHEIKDLFRYRDLVDFKKFDREYENFLFFGGFPEVVLTNDEATKKEILKNIFASFFEKDLRVLSDYKDIRELRDLILLLVPRVGSMLDVSKLASELGVDRVKLYSYLGFLQGTFFIRLIPKFSKSIDRSVAGGRKVYFTDTGMLNSIGRVNDGQLLENAVVNQLGEYGDISFYNKRNTSEIDVILNKEYALEIKLKGTERDVEGLKKTASGIGVLKSCVVSRGFTEEKGVAYPLFL